MLAEIMVDPSAPVSVRAEAATQLINRGWGTLGTGHVRFVPDRREYYVYSVHKSGALVYIGKGIGRRSFVSAQRLGGKARIRAVFSSEKQALVFEARLIRRFKPRENITHNRPQLRVVGNG